MRKKNKGQGGVGTGVSGGQYVEPVKTEPGARAQLSERFSEQKAVSLRAGDLIRHEGRDLEVTGLEHQRNNPGWIDGLHAPLGIETFNPIDGQRETIRTTVGAMIPAIKDGATTRKREAIRELGDELRPRGTNPPRIPDELKPKPVRDKFDEMLDDLLDEED